MRIIRGALVLAAVVALAVAVALIAGCSSGTAPSTGGYTAPGTGGGSGASTGASSTTGGAAGGVAITVQNFAFSPNPATAKVGEAVTFTNQDSVQHNIAVNGQESGPIGQGQSWTVKIDKAGTYPITCKIHPSMSGSLEVK